MPKDDREILHGIRLTDGHIITDPDDERMGEVPAERLRQMHKDGAITGTWAGVKAEQPVQASEGEGAKPASTKTPARK